MRAREAIGGFCADAESGKVMPALRGNNTGEVTTIKPTLLADNIKAILAVAPTPPAWEREKATALKDGYIAWLFAGWLAAANRLIQSGISIGL
jgi:hypothetical protein